MKEDSLKIEKLIQELKVNDERRACDYEETSKEPKEAIEALAAMRRICKKAGAERVSESACLELARVLEEVGVKIGKEALEYMLHARRKTVKGKDIKIAAKKFMS